MTAHGTELEARDRVNADVRDHVASAETAATSGDLSRASALYLEAGRAAAGDTLWRVTIRCFRAALEIDLTDREVVARLLALGARGGDDWSAYARALDREDWPRFGCRAASIVIDDDGATVHCPQVGPVLAIAMTERDLVKARPHSRFAGIPVAMALIILRRALWPDARALWLEQRHRPAMQVRIDLGAQHLLWLDELGDWRSR
jgi:hypothetical protein